MRMNDMNKLFEQRGFEVKRIYRDGHYIFSITKDNYCLSAIYVYPACTTYDLASRHQKEFVESTIKKFEEDFKERNMNKNIIDIIDKGVYGIDITSSRAKYVSNDISTAQRAYLYSNQNPVKKEPGISKVIFNPPATIIIWDDDTKTVVKCGENDTYDAEKGMAMAICKKAFGNKGNYCNIFKQWLPKEEVQVCLNCKHGDKSMDEDPCYGCGKIFTSTDPRKPLKSNWEPKTESTESK